MANKEQKERLALLKAQAAERQKINAVKKEELAYQDEILRKEKQKQDLMKSSQSEAQKINDLLSDNVSLEDQILTNKKSIDAETSKQAALQKQALAVMNKQLEAGNISEQQYKSQAAMMNTIASGQSDINDLMQMQSDLAENGSEHMKAYVDSQLKAKQAAKEGEEVQSGLDDATGGMLEKAQNFSKLMSNPAMMGVAVVAALVMAMKAFSESLDKIGEDFGAIGVKEFAGDLMAADAEMAKLGYDAGSAAEVTTALADGFGVGMDQAMGMAAQVGDMSKALGLSLTEGSQLMGMFTEIGGMTPQQAEDTAKMAAQLANANNVNPASVLKDIAGSTETFAKFGKDGGKNLVEAAIVAKKLGTNLDAVAGTMEGMLDFAGSTSKAMEASVMVGRDINIQKMQELSLAGDAVGVLEEQKRLLGDEASFNNMNLLQRKALAESLGLSVEEASKMISKQEEAATLAGELAKQPGFEELVGKEALSSLSQLMGSLTSIAAVLTNVLGPPLNFIMSIFAETANVIGFVTEQMTASIPVMVATGVTMAWMGRKALINAIMGIWSGLKWMWSIPVVGPGLAIATGIGASMAIYKQLAGAKATKVEDAGIPARGKGPVVTTPEGKMFEGIANDDVMMAPGIAGTGAAVATANNSNNGAVVSALNTLNETTRANKISEKEIGQRTGRALVDLGDG